MRALAVAVLLGSCTSHVQLRPIDPPTLTPAQRVGLFMRLRPVAEGTVTTDGVETSKTLVLADDTEIVAPEDLEPLVGRDSETMNFARESQSARTKNDAVWIATGVGILAGALLSGFVIRDEPAFGLSPWVGYGLMIGSAILGAGMTRHYVAQELELRKQAFASYPRDLGLMLDVCAHGMKVVACELPVEPTPVPPGQPKEPATTMPDRTALRMRR